MVKHLIRKKFILKRDQQSEKELLAKSEKIKETLFSLPEFQRADTILLYVAFKSEVKTKQIIQDALALGKRLAVPVADRATKILTFSELRDFDKELEEGPLGILEPKRKYHRSVSAREFDLIIVPGIAFDHIGHRVGYGSGYYDRFLSILERRVPLIGLAYELQIVEEIPHEAHDIMVNKIITEERMINCV